jgi:uncharacterized protein (TIRG00374 family)
VVRPGGRGPLELSATEPSGRTAIVELYGPNQRSGGALRQFWRWLMLRDKETAPVQMSLHRAVEHRALMTIAVGDLDIANTSTLCLAGLERGWTVFAHSPPRGTLLPHLSDPDSAAAVWNSLRVLHSHQIAHGDLQATEISVEGDTGLFGGFGNSEYGASDEQLQSDVAQLLVTTTESFGAKAAVEAAIAAVGTEIVLAASRRLTRSAMPKRITKGLSDSKAVLASVRDEVKLQTGAAQIQTETVTRFTRKQIVQLVLLVALVYVAYPFISTVPAFLSELRHANWWWALLGLAVSALTYVGAAAGLWACAGEVVSFRHLVIMQFANTFAATTTPAGVGGLALSTRFLQKAGLGAVRATAAVAVQQAVQVITHIALLIFFSVAAGASADLSHFVPKLTLLYLIGGLALGAIGAFLFVPKLRHWLDTAVRPKINEVGGDLVELVREPRRFALIVLGCAGTTLGAALALWASVEAFGGGTTFVTVTVVTMVGGTLASAAPTPGGVGAVEAALIGGLAAFGVPTAIAVPSVLLYRVLTVWLPVFAGWPIMRWLTNKDMI